MGVNNFYGYEYYNNVCKWKKIHQSYKEENALFITNLRSYYINKQKHKLELYRIISIYLFNLAIFIILIIDQIMTCKS